MLNSLNDKKKIEILERSLMDSQSRLADFIELAPNFYWETDEFANFTYMSEKFSNVAERSVDSFIGQNSRKLFPLYGTQEEIQAYAEGAAKLEPFRDALLKYTTEKGKDRYLNVNGKPYFSNEGTFIGYRGHSNDITQSIELKQNLAEKITILEEAAKLAYIGYWQYYYPTKEFFWSREIYRIAGLPYFSKIPLDRGFKIYTPESEKLAKDHAKKSRENGEKYQLDLRVIRPDGEMRNVVLTGNCIFSAKGEILSHYGILQDVTDKVKIEHHQQKMEKQLQHSQKMEMVGQLTGGVAHDFNNLLSVIIGNIELLEEMAEPGSKQIKILQSIERSAVKGANLTQRLLAYSSKLLLMPELINMNKLIQDMDERIKMSVESNVTVFYEYEPSVWPCLIDSQQLQTSIINLCRNAGEAMQQEGELRIAVKNKSMTHVEGTFEQDFIPGDYILITIEDQGCGINEKSLPRVFEPFFTTKDTSTGSGLGLSSVYGFIRQSKGAITLKSVENSGTTVFVYLPRKI